MDRRTKLKVMAGAAGVAAIAGGGGLALAATQSDAPRQANQAIVEDAAKQLGVQPSALSDALKNGLEKRVEADVSAGRLTKQQGEAIKARIESGAVPLFAGPPPLGEPDHVHGLDAAASYLGLSEAQLHSELEGGKTLAQIAKDRDKSVDGLIHALVADAKKHLDADVAAGRLTEAQAQSILSDVKEHVADLVNGKAPDGEPRFHRFRGGPPVAFPLPPAA